MEKKYEFTKETINARGRILHRIRALRDFGHVKAGELGGFIEKEDNLSHEGNCWVSGNARVYGNAIMSGNAQVSGYAHVHGNAEVFGNARVSGYAHVHGNAEVFGNARVSGDAKVSDGTRLSIDALIETDNDYVVVKGFGLTYRSTTFYLTKDKHIRVACGWFNGTLEEFRSKVKRTYPNHRFGKEYLMIADVMEKIFKGRNSIKHII